jgi:hypothetical protein
MRPKEYVPVIHVACANPASTHRDTLFRRAVDFDDLESATITQGTLTHMMGDTY